MKDTLTMADIERAVASLPPAPDRLQIRVHGMHDFHLIAEILRLSSFPNDLQSILVGSGIELLVDEYIPPGIAIERNLTREQNLTIRSTVEEISSCIRIIDLRAGTGRQELIP